MQSLKFFAIIIIGSIFFCGCQSAVVEKKESLPYYSNASFTPVWKDKEHAGTIHTIPSFSFTNQLNEKITNETFDGKISVVNFFFASCPGICKQLTSNLSKVQDEFKNDKVVLLLSHSVTPRRDSVPVLYAYMKEHGIIPGKWHLVTGNEQSIYHIARAGYFADEDMGLQNDSTSFLHTENVLLVDGKHHIRGVYKGTMPADIQQLIKDIYLLKQE